MVSRSGSTLIVPARIQEQFPELIGYILQSESMNDEERQYWIDILPVMSAEQTAQLKDILESEKKQLADIDQKYNKQLEEMTAGTRSTDQIAKERRARSSERHGKEDDVRKKEVEAADQILKELD